VNVTDDAGLFEELTRAMRAGEPRALVTVVAAKGSVPRQPGAVMLVASGPSTWGTIGGGKMEGLVTAAALEVLASGQATLRDFPLHENHPDSFGAICGGTVTLFIQPLPSVPRLVVMGAGHCAAALSHQAQLLHWRVEVWEDRPEFLLPERFAPGTALHATADMRAAARSLVLDGTSAVCMLNRSSTLDRECVLGLAERGEAAAQPFYLGMIGSRRKVQIVRQELEGQGVAAAFLQRLQAPLGLEIHAETPEEIAVSIVGQIIGDWRLRQGAALRGAL